jgi:ubiquinone biosynthesis protein
MLPFVRQTRHLGRYRQIVQVFAHHGFGYLMEQLGLVALLSLPRRLILRVPPTPPVGVAERLCQALVELGPTFVKIGQFLSTRPDVVPADFVAELEKLQDTVPSFSSDIAISTIESELGQPIDALFKEFTREPLAAASLGQVHGAVLHSGEHVAVKVQRPDIAGLIETDLSIISDLAALAQERTWLGQEYDLVELAWEFSTTLRRELDYVREAKNAERFRQIFANNPKVLIPRIYYEYTSNRVLTTERIYGVKITQVAKIQDAGINTVQLAQNATEVIFQEIFSGFFHSDPHPGNLFALEGDRVGAVDFGQVGILDREMTRNVMFMVMAIIRRDTEDALRSLEGLNIIERQNVTPGVRRDMQLFIDSMAGQRLNQISAHVVGGEMFAMVRRHKLTMPGPIAVLLKSIIMMEGIGLQLDPNLNVFGVAKPYAQQAMAEEFSPKVVRQRLFHRARIMGDTAFELPEQIGNILRRLDDGEIRLQTSEQEMRSLSRAIISAANYLSLAIVLSAIILGLGLVAVAGGIGGWSGPIPRILIVMGTLGALLAALFLVLAMMRGRNI